MKLHRIPDNGFGRDFKQTRNENYDTIEKGFSDIGTNFESVKSDITDVSMKVSNASSDNIFYGSDGSKTMDEIKNHIDELFVNLTEDKSLISNNTFYVSGGGYFFYKIKAINQFSPGKKISMSVNFDVDSQSVKKQCRFIDSSGNTVDKIITFDGKDGFYLTENITVPSNATTIEFRIDARELTSTAVSFDNPRIIAGAFVGAINNTMIKEIEKINKQSELIDKQKFGPEDINYFPDPLLIQGTWINYSVPNTPYEFITKNNEKRLVLKNRIDIANQVGAIGYDFSISSKNLKIGDKIDVDTNVVEYSNGINARFFMRVMFLNSNKVEWDSSLRKSIYIGKIGNFPINEIVIPDGTIYIRLRLDAESRETISPQARVEFNEINITMSKSSVKKTKTAVNSMIVAGMINDSLSKFKGDKTLYVSTKGNDTASGETSNQALKTIQRAIDLGATKIIVERGAYYEQEINASKLEQVRIIAGPYSTYNVDNPKIHDAKKVTLIGGKKLEGWEAYNSIFRLSYTGNPFFRSVFIEQSVPPMSSSSRPAPNATVIENDEPLIPVLSLAECETTKGTLFYDGMHVYINSFDGNITDKIYHVPEKDNILNLKGTSKVYLEDVELRYCMNLPIILDEVGSFYIKNCSFSHSVKADGSSIDNTNGILVNCNAHHNRNDGFNFHGYGDTLLINCNGFYNKDDGISHHDGCTGFIIGGEWYGNGKAGIAPTYGAIVHVQNVICYKNVYGLYFVGTKGVTPRRSIHVVNVLCYENTRSGVFVSHEYDVTLENGNLRNNSVGSQVDSNGSLLIEKSLVNENTSAGISNVGELTVTIKDCKISDNRKGVQNLGSGKTILSRNGILYSAVSGIQLTSGTVVMDKRNNLYGNSTDYEGSIPQIEKDKNVSIPAI